MKNLLLSLIAIVLVLITNGQTLSENLSDTLTKRLAQLKQQQNVKSISSAVYFPDGSIWESSKGQLGNTGPLTTDHLMEMGSNTKTFVAAILLQMQEEGLLSLEDTIYQYINKLPHVPSGISIRQVLNHTSGIYDYTTHPRFATKINNNPTIVIPPDSLFNFMDEPLFPVGSSWSYCNTGYVIAGLIIEAVDGKPLLESLRDRLLTPLGLQNTYLDVYESYNEPKAGSWLANGVYLGIKFDSFLSAARAAGAILATTADLVEWAFMLYSGKVLDSTSLADMLTRVVVNGNTTNYGLGYFFTRFKGKTYHGHGGTTPQNSTMNYSEDLKYAIVLNVNEQNKSTQINTIQNLLIDVIEAEMPKFSYEPVGITNHQSISNKFLYPNPASDWVSLGENIYKQCLIYDLTGKQVLSVNYPQNKIDISTLNEGIYFFNLTDIDGQVQTQKLLIY